MKKIITILLIAILSFSSVFAYTQTELDTKKTSYKKVLKIKFSSKLEKMSDKKLKKISTKIWVIIEIYKNKNISDSKKLKYISILTAFKEIIDEKVEDEYLIISDIIDDADKKIEVTIISDKRCWVECDTDYMISQLKQVEELKNINFKVLDFDEQEAKDIMKKNNITKLPAVLLNDNSVESLKNYLEKTKNWDYSLNVWGSFDPYEKRSVKWFQVLDKEIITKIKKSSYIKWYKNSKILYLEYSDMECPFCAKLHNNWTLSDLEKKYWTKLSYSLQHFPLGFHKNALPAAEALECLAKQKGGNSYFKLEHIIFENKKSNIEFIIEESVKLWANKEKLKKCIENKEFEEKINAQQKQWTNLFWITWTPWNVLINTKTGEYKVITGAYPTSEFIKVIDKLLK